MAEIDEDTVGKFDYLKAKYVFRYPFTFKAIKWGGVIGSFLALHAFVKHRSVKKSLQVFIWGSVFSGFPIWAFFMAKYNFYQDSIQSYEREELQKLQEFNDLKALIEHKLSLPPNHGLEQEQLMKKYQDFVDEAFRRNSRLDVLLTGITDKTFD